MANAISNDIEPLGYSIPDAQRRIGVGRTTIYRLAKDRQLEMVKVRGRSIITDRSLRKLVGG